MNKNEHLLAQTVPPLVEMNIEAYKTAESRNLIEIKRFCTPLNNDDTAHIEWTLFFRNATSYLNDP